MYYSYDADRPLITEVRNTWGSDPNDPNNIVSKYTYAYDDLGRASSVVREGDASFAAFANDHHDAYTYGDRNELNSHAEAIARLEPEAVIDMVCFTEAQVDLVRADAREWAKAEAAQSA